MTNEFVIKQIAHIQSDFHSKFGIPRQSGVASEVSARIIFEERFRDANAVRGLEGFSHIWLIWQFSKAIDKAWSPTVKPPRLGGNTRMGVFATRSPFRPNHMGLSCVALEKIEYTKKWGPVLHITGADLLDQTPIYDVKPYLPYVDSKPEAVGGFAEQISDYELEVIFPEEWLCKVPKEKRAGLTQVLSQDPRPSYQEESDRIYGMEFANLEVKFTVRGTQLTVYSVGIREDRKHEVRYAESKE